MPAAEVLRVRTVCARPIDDVMTGSAGEVSKVCSENLIFCHNPSSITRNTALDALPKSMNSKLFEMNY